MRRSALDGLSPSLNSRGALSGTTEWASGEASYRSRGELAERGASSAKEE